MTIRNELRWEQERMRTIYLQVGYHKTATTFLQQYIYPKLKQVNYIKQKQIKSYLQDIRLRHLSNTKVEEIRSYVDSFDNDNPILISYEGLSGSPFAPRKTKKQANILIGLQRIFPAAEYDVHVIVGIRSQVALFTSLYIQHIHMGGVLDAYGYLNYCRNNGSLQSLNFHNYLQKVEKTFGRDRLYVMIYEDFRQNPADEIRKLLHFMGEREIPKYSTKTSARKSNKSYGVAQVRIARKLNKYFKSRSNPKGRIPTIRIPKIGKLAPRTLLQTRISYTLHYKKYELPEDIRELLKERYAEGNKKLAKRYDLELPDIRNKKTRR